MVGRSKRVETRHAGLARERRGAAGPTGSQAVERQGPPAVALARRIYAERHDVIVAPFETLFRADAGDVLVRAWVRIPANQVPPAHVTSIDVAARAFAADAMMQTVFFLSASYRLGVDEIARQLGVRRWRIRSILRRAIARLDRVSREPAPTARSAPSSDGG
jgi:hypothetical protein